MIEMMVTVAVTAGAFVATNLDNLILLVALYTRYERRPVMVAGGYFAGMLIVGAASFAIGKATELFALEYLGLLGIIPILIGVTAALKLFRGVAPDDGNGERPLDGSFAAFAATLFVQLSNGTDTVVTFSILFADSVGAADYWIVVSYIVMLCVFASAGYYSLRHQWLSGVVGRYGRFVTPFILISIGLFVLSNTAMDMTPG